MAKINNTKSKTFTHTMPPNASSTLYSPHPFTYKGKEAVKAGGGYMVEINKEHDLIKDAKKRTAERDKMDTMSVIAILAGLVAIVAVLLWAGTIADAFIGVIGM